MCDIVPLSIHQTVVSDLVLVRILFLFSVMGDVCCQLGGKRVGIVGLGKIGLLVAKRLEAFGCSISYNSRKKKDFVSYPFYSNVGDLAANSDALIIVA